MLVVIATLLAVFVLPPALGVAAVALAVGAEVGEVLLWRRFLRRYRVQTGVEGLIGSAAEVSQALTPEGRVRLRGETWRARAAEAVPVGARVRVTGVDGLTLEVVREK
jgi:membrane protein implicated in regulation of membrane protease activity